MAPAEFFSRLGDAAVFLPLLSAITGGVLAKVKAFLPDERDVERRIDLKRDGLFDRIASRHQKLLDGLLEKMQAVELRGNPPREPDLLVDYVADLFRSFSMVTELDVIFRRIRACYTALLYTVILGLAGSAVACLWEGSRPCVATLAILMILAQLFIACFIRRLEGRVKELSRVT